MQTVWLSKWLQTLVLSVLTRREGLMPLCSSTIFTIEYNFNATQIVNVLGVCAVLSMLTPSLIQGLTNLGGIVGIVLATAITGPLTDWGTVWLSKRNKGIYEPEFRIIFMLSMLVGVFGYIGWAGEEELEPVLEFCMSYNHINLSSSRNHPANALDRSRFLHCVRLI